MDVLLSLLNVDNDKTEAEPAVFGGEKEFLTRGEEPFGESCKLLKRFASGVRGEADEAMERRDVLPAVCGGENI